jgi:SHS2 domain-containing protein
VFEILEHTADVGFRARAASLPALFENAAEALVAIAMETGHIEPRQSYQLEAEGDSNESLLVNWLSEVLYQLDGEHLALRDFRVTEYDSSRVRGQALGEPRVATRHAPKLVIKGVTYHQLKIEQDTQGWYCEVYLDI